MAPFVDIKQKRPTTGGNIDALDGLRGIAVLLVVADHTWGWFSGLGASGVWIFMSLSGFLLARPFVQQPELASSLSFWQHFFLRRAWRIIPVYYVYIVIIYLFNARFDEALLHFLFLKGSGHLWVVPQEMLFYLLTPPVMLFNYLILRGRSWLIIPCLIVLTILVNRFLDTDIIALYGMHNILLRPFFGIFLGGIIISWFYYGIWQKKNTVLLHKRIEFFAAALVVLLLLFFLLCSHERLWGGERILTQLYFPWYGAAAGLLILAVLIAGQSTVNQLLSSLPLRALSLVSYSIYIFHPLILGVIRKGIGYYYRGSITGFPLFITTLLLSYLFACLSYSLLERPFLRSPST
ncbi:MAG: acyltransferase [Candidatus Electrothrix sp. AR3]|nr:acyltransferase [Candidatus Electrothrix sp. AR3]